MKKNPLPPWRNVNRTGLPLLACLACQFAVEANPTGGSVSQGSATISTLGSQVTINQSSANAFINWQSFNLAPGETTTFNQPSASSVTWNYINDPNASSINGNLNANGYVILQNPNGFTIGGSAVINTHGLVMTTASTPALDLSSGGPWAFNAPPPTAKIVNYGQINIAGGGSAYLIASDIENNGTISAPGGKIGLYAGQKVLVSMAPDGRGLSAQVTIPEGSVNNSGQLIADAGSIAAQAQFVNQAGLVQANTVQNVNGVIELVAGDTLSLAANSQISAKGDATASGSSVGGFVVLNAGHHTFSDLTGSAISLAGVNGGQAGILEIMGNGVTAANVNSSYGSPYAFLANPNNITLSSSATSSSANPNLNTSALAKYSQIDLQALNNIELNANWILADSTSPSVLVLTAANNVILDNGTTLDAGQGWLLKLVAGDGILVNNNNVRAEDVYINSDSIQTIQGGNINLEAAKNLELNSIWTLTDLGSTADLNLSAGNNLTLSDGMAINAGEGWNLSLSADHLIANNASLQADNLAVATSVVQPTDGGTISFQAANKITMTSQGTPGPSGGAFGTVSLLAGQEIALDAGSMIETAGGNISLNAPTIHQSGALKADSIWNSDTTIGNKTGTVNIEAGSLLDLGASSFISAAGDLTGASAGGSIILQSGGTFSDQSGSVIQANGGLAGGKGGSVAITAPQMSVLQSALSGQAASGYANGTLSIGTGSITLNADGSPVAGRLVLNTGSLGASFSHVNLQADDNIEVVSLWTLLPKNGILDTISLMAGNTISVDANAGIQTDGGKITLASKTVNQNGILRANSVGTANGVIEINANQSLALGASSQISASGDAAASSASSGGFVILNAGKNIFSDLTGSTISVDGAHGGQAGILEIFGNGVTTASIHSTYGSPYAFLVDPNNLNSLTISSSATSSPNPSNPNLYNIDTSALAKYSQIDLQALNDITLSSVWTLANSANSAALNLSAGNNLTLNSSLTVGTGWSINLDSGLQQVTGGIYLNGTSTIQSQDGGINLFAAKEVIVNSGGIRTLKGGDITVTTASGDVNTGTSTAGYNYYAPGNGTAAKPYYTPFQLSGSGNSQTINFSQSNLGGISTAAGGNVTITAGGDVISLPTTTVASGDPGSGAFGAQPGNVSITAGGNVYGHFVEANGTATIHAGQNIGTEQQNVSLSLVKGSWDLNAIGDIYLQEVRNPNGVFNNTTTGLGSAKKNSAGNHLFDYDSMAALDLTAGNGVYLTGYYLPRPNGAVPMLLPPTLVINAGSGGITLQTPSATGNGTAENVALSDYDITLFPSSHGNLQLNTDGDFTSGNANGSAATLLMSDSGQTHWFVASSGPQPFSETDHATGEPIQRYNENPVVLNISRNMENVILQVDKFAQINIGGDLIDCSFFGENLNASDVTSVTVGGQIYNRGSFNSATLNDAFPGIPAADTPPGTVNSWFTTLLLAVDLNKLPTTSLIGKTSDQLNGYLNTAREFPSIYFGNLAYDSSKQVLTAIGPMTSDLLAALTSTSLTLVRYGRDGSPLVDTNQKLANGEPNPNYGHFVTDTITWVPAKSANGSLISSLYTASQNSSPLGVSSGGLVVGGTGTFDVTASSISLGNSSGILSVGNGGSTTTQFLGRNYSYLTSYINSGATINVVADYLEMPSSTIAALGGGDVNVTCNGLIPNSPVNGNGIGISMDLGSQDLLPFEAQIMAASNIGLGIYTSGGGNVSVTGLGTINIDSSRIATFNGGDVTITSITGDVNAGNGGAISIPINSFSPLYPNNTYEPVEYVYANGIVANTLAPLADGSTLPGAATQPGNIIVRTPQGSIYASVGGILQETLNGALLPGPYITLEAGTPANGDWNSSAQPDYFGDILLGNSGAIGGTVNLKATGKVSGVLVSSQNANVTSQTLGALTVLAGGLANVSSQGSSGAGITIIGGQGVSASGIGSGATVLGQNVSVNGAAAQSTLGNSASASGTSASAAGQASSQAQQQVSNNDAGDDDEKKKKKPELRKVSRVTVILSSAVPPQ